MFTKLVRTRSPPEWTCKKNLLISRAHETLSHSHEYKGKQRQKKTKEERVLRALDSFLHIQRRNATIPGPRHFLRSGTLKLITKNSRTVGAPTTSGAAVTRRSSHPIVTPLCTLYCNLRCMRPFGPFAFNKLPVYAHQ